MLYGIAQKENIMGIKKYKPYTPSRRNMTGSDFAEITKQALKNHLWFRLRKTREEIIRER